ncbi:MAG TPA: hypothetical protein VN493_05955 [Thermoanaerobaculia bacterium]|nr:hypothetical protein [Thermoanaerobaculia bacterium]
MSANRPESAEGAVLRSVSEVVGAAEKKSRPWPELDEPRFESVPERPVFVERVILWTMAGIVGAVTIAAITRWDRELLIVVLGFAATTLLGLAGLKRGGSTPQKRDHDPRTKGKSKKRTKSN